MTQTTRWTESFLTIAKVWTWSCDLQVWNASILAKHAGGSPWPPLLSSPCSPRRCQWSRRRPRGKATPSWTRRIRTLVCDSLDWSNSWVFSYCVLRFSQLPSFVQNISTFSYFVQTRLPRVLHFPRWSCKVVFHRNVTWQLHFLPCVKLSYYQHFQLANITVDKNPSSQFVHYSLECQYSLWDVTKFLPSRSHSCDHFKELRINNTGGTVVYFSDCWGTQILWEVSLGKSCAM